MADVTLSASIRSNLLSLNNTSGLINTTQGRLSTGLKVSSPIDDAVAYFQGKALSDRAADMTERKAGIDQGISSLKSSINALESIEKIVKQMKGVLLSAKSATAAEKGDLQEQFTELANQVNYLANDATYQGLNLVNSTGNTLTVNFSDASDAKLDVSGVNVLTSVLFTTGAVASELATQIGAINGAWSEATAVAISDFEDAVDEVDDALTNIRSNVKTLGSNVALLQTRLDFTKNYANTLEEGSGKLTLADLNEEGANLVALQTRQQLGIQALQFAGQSEQAILRLFG